MSEDRAPPAPPGATSREGRTTEPGIHVARRVAVFGSSRSDMDPELFREIEGLGRKLAEDGFVVVNGGYGGVMHAVSKGASEAGGTVFAVTAEYNPDEHPNRYAHFEVRHADMLERLRYLVETADAFLVLPGGSGTLTEFMAAWSVLKTQAWGHDAPPLLVWQDPWKEIVEALEWSPGFWRPELGLLTWVENGGVARELLREQVTVGTALTRFEEDTPPREKALRDYLSSHPRSVRHRLASLNPVVWTAPSPWTRRDAYGLARSMFDESAAALEELDELPWQEVIRTSADVWASEFVRPVHGPTHLRARARRLDLGDRQAGLQEYESLHGEGDPAPLDEGGKGDRIFRIFDVEAGWFVAMQCGTGGGIAVGGRTPHATHSLVERVQLVLAAPPPEGGAAA